MQHCREKYILPGAGSHVGILGLHVPSFRQVNVGDPLRTKKLTQLSVIFVPGSCSDPLTGVWYSYSVEVGVSQLADTK